MMSGIFELFRSRTSAPKTGAKAATQCPASAKPGQTVPMQGLTPAPDERSEAERRLRRVAKEPKLQSKGDSYQSLSCIGAEGKFSVSASLKLDLNADDANLVDGLFRRMSHHNDASLQQKDPEALRKLLGMVLIAAAHARFKAGPHGLNDDIPSSHKLRFLAKHASAETRKAIEDLFHETPKSDSTPVVERKIDVAALSSQSATAASSSDVSSPTLNTIRFDGARSMLMPMPLLVAAFYYVGMDALGSLGYKEWLKLLLKALKSAIKEYNIFQEKRNEKESQISLVRLAVLTDTQSLDCMCQCIGVPDQEKKQFLAQVEQGWQLCSRGASIGELKAAEELMNHFERWPIPEGFEMMNGIPSIVGDTVIFTNRQSNSLNSFIGRSVYLANHRDPADVALILQRLQILSADDLRVSAVFSYDFNSPLLIEQTPVFESFESLLENCGHVHQDLVMRLCLDTVTGVQQLARIGSIIRHLRPSCFSVGCRRLVGLCMQVTAEAVSEAIATTTSNAVVVETAAVKSMTDSVLPAFYDELIRLGSPAAAELGKLIKELDAKSDKSYSLEYLMSRLSIMLRDLREQHVEEAMPDPEFPKDCCTIIVEYL